MSIELEKTGIGYVCRQSFKYTIITTGDEEATLDGDFTSAELRAIADKLDEVNKGEDTGNGRTMD